KDAVQVVIGSFLNISVLAEYLLNEPHHVLILCAGWKGKFNLEDTLFAGALTKRLSSEFKEACDAPMADVTLYEAAKHDMAGFLANSPHVKRLQRLDIHKDIDFCLQEDIYPVIPVLKKGKLVKLKLKQPVKNHKVVAVK